MNNKCKPKSTAVVRSPLAVVHIITGDGKGKSTAAFGLALRALGAGKKVAIIQFMKNKDTSEYKAIKKYKLPIDISTYGAGFYKILGDKKPKEVHQKEAENGFRKAEKIIFSLKYDLVILDEINVALSCKLIDIEKVIDLLEKIKSENQKIDLVLTGRDAEEKIKKMADLVSVIKKEKHYFDKGILARRGIEY